MRRWTLMAAIALAASGLVNGGSHEKRLLSDLLDTYNVLERPVGNESDPLVLSFGLTLMQIIDVTQDFAEKENGNGRKQRDETEIRAPDAKSPWNLHDAGISNSWQRIIRPEPRC
nr:PREDICTED: neuronal acetylcholine receptor subunit alpha-7-like [Megachile rotundata]